MQDSKLVRPPKPPRASRKPERTTWLSPVRKRAKLLALRAVDRGWFGLEPLRAHLIICGFPRSGTTLLQLMAQTAYPSARAFDFERSGLAAARNDFPGRAPLLISKQPDDIFWIDEIRECYAERRTRTRVHFIVNIRDPRAVLTSVHGMNRDVYWVTPERWRAIHAHFQYARRFEDVDVLDYNDLILSPQKVESLLAHAIGMTPERSLSSFHTMVPSTFNTTALNGVRPLDPSTIEKWRAPQHRDRIIQLLREMPDLPTLLIELGYEPDTAWTADYR